MTLAEQGHRLRTEILGLGIAHARRYQPKLRRRILAWVERAKQEGMSEHACGKRLGIPYRRFATWRTRHHVEPPKRLVEIEIAKADSPPVTYAIVSPSGYRIDGLTLDQAVAFMRALA